MSRLVSALLRRDPALIVATVLVLATVLSWGLSVAELEVGPAMTVVIVVIAFVKVWLVGRYFMDLRHAPRGLRALFDAYAAGACLAVLVAYLV